VVEDVLRRQAEQHDEDARDVDEKTRLERTALVSLPDWPGLQRDESKEVREESRHSVTRQEDGDVGSWQLRVVAAADGLVNTRDKPLGEEEEEAAPVRCGTSKSGQEGDENHGHGLENESGNKKCRVVKLRTVDRVK